MRPLARLRHAGLPLPLPDSVEDPTARRQPRRLRRIERGGILLLAVTLLNLAQLLDARQLPGGSVETGRVIFERHCAACHGSEGRGDGPQAPFLSPRPSNLISAATSVKTDAELLAIIARGKPRTSMPGWEDRLTEPQRRDVLSYIRSLIRFYPEPAPPPPPSSAER